MGLGSNAIVLRKLSLSSVALGLLVTGSNCWAEDVGFRIGDAFCNVLTFNSCGRQRDEERAEVNRRRAEELRIAAEQARISKIHSLKAQAEIYLSSRDVDLKMFGRIVRMRSLVSKTIHLTLEELNNRSMMRKKLGDLQRDFSAFAKMGVLKDLLLSSTQQGPDSIYEAYTLIGKSAEGNQLNIEITLKGLLDLTQTTALSSMLDILIELHNNILGDLFSMTVERFGASADHSTKFIMELFPLDRTVAQGLLDRQNAQVVEMSNISKKKALPTAAELMSGSLATLASKP